MEDIPDDKWDEHGCFVYRILKRVKVRTFTNVGDECKSEHSFNVGNLVSVDLIHPSRFPKSTNGPFLRLTDKSGWLFEKKYGERFLQRLPVTSGLWSFYVDNGITGMALRCHPFDDSPKVDPEKLYPPMQMIYCDRKVVDPTDGVCSYRVQGTDGWVFEKRRMQREGPEPMMIPDSFVKTGLFAYEVADGNKIIVRLNPDISRDSSNSSRITIDENEIVCCDVIRETYPTADGNGPFLRLTDGSGWVFVKTSSDTEVFMRPLPIQDGNWNLEAMNEPVGIGLRRQPMDRQDMRIPDIVYAPGDRVECDKKVTSPSGTSFYRVTGTDGWVFDVRNGEPMMNVISSEGTNTEQFVLGNDQTPWTVDYIRGIAAAYDLEEIACNETSRYISFRTDDNTRINIYYTTRTIGTALDHPSQGKTQLFRRQCTLNELKQIMHNPRSHTGKGYKKRLRGGGTAAVQSYHEHEDTSVIDEEEDFRNALLKYDTDISKLCKERDSILKSLKRHDDKRASEATRMMKKAKDHRTWVEQQIANAAEKERRKKAAIEEEERRKIAAAIEKTRQRLAAAEEAEHQRRKLLTCGECYREFSSEYARDQHCRDAHGLQCYECGKIFKSQNGLNNHRDAVGHW